MDTHKCPEELKLVDVEVIPSPSPCKSSLLCEGPIWERNNFANMALVEGFDHLSQEQKQHRDRTAGPQLPPVQPRLSAVHHQSLAAVHLRCAFSPPPFHLRSLEQL